MIFHFSSKFNGDAIFQSLFLNFLFETPFVYGYRLNKILRNTMKKNSIIILLKVYISLRKNVAI